MKGPTVQAIAMLVGTIVGVGVFALPFAFAQAGFFVGLGFLTVLGVAVVFLHLFYGEMVLRTSDSLHLTGYGERYFGKIGKWLLTVVAMFGLVGALLAYIIISGQFLETIIGAISTVVVGQEFWLSTLFFVAASFFSFLGIRRIAVGELVLASTLITVVLFIVVDAARFVRIENLFSSSGSLFLPYGVVLFSLLGTSAIPEVREILLGASGAKTMKRAIIWGTVIPIVLYALFSFVVVGTTGSATSQEPFQGLAGIIGLRAIVFGSIFGFLAILTSYLVLALNGIETLMQSYDFSHKKAWFVISGAPFAFFLFGARNFVGIVDVVGTTLTAAIGTAIVLMLWRSRREGDRTPEYELSHPYIVGWSLITLFIVALIIRFLVI